MSYVNKNLEHFVPTEHKKPLKEWSCFRCFGPCLVKQGLIFSVQMSGSEKSEEPSGRADVLPGRRDADMTWGCVSGKSARRCGFEAPGRRCGQQLFPLVAHTSVIREKSQRLCVICCCQVISHRDAVPEDSVLKGDLAATSPPACGLWLVRNPFRPERWAAGPERDCLPFKMLFSVVKPSKWRFLLTLLLQMISLGVFKCVQFSQKQRRSIKIIQELHTSFTWTCFVWEAFVLHSPVSTIMLNHNLQEPKQGHVDTTFIPVYTLQPSVVTLPCFYALRFLPIELNKSVLNLRWKLIWKRINSALTCLHHSLMGAI